MSERVRLNLGCGAFKLDGYTNIDADPACRPDVCATVPPIPFPDSAAREVYAGHLLEHYDQAGGQALLADCYRVLCLGGTLTVVVPDTRAIMRRWLRGATTTQLGADGRRYRVADLDDVCAYWLYSTVQPSRHAWSYCWETLVRAVERAGFVVQRQIDRYHDPRLSDPSFWQLGVEAVRPC